MYRGIFVVVGDWIFFVWECFMESKLCKRILWCWVANCPLEADLFFCVDEGSFQEDAEQDCPRLHGFDYG